MCMVNLRTRVVGAGPGTRARPDGSIARELNGYWDSAFGEPSLALTPVFPGHGQTIPSIFDIIRLPTKSAWKILAEFPAELPEWSLSATRFQAPPTFRSPMMVLSIKSSSSLADRVSLLLLATACQGIGPLWLLANRCEEQRAIFPRLRPDRL